MHYKGFGFRVRVRVRVVAELTPSNGNSRYIYSPYNTSTSVHDIIRFIPFRIITALKCFVSINEHV